MKWTEPWTSNCDKAKWITHRRYIISSHRLITILLQIVWIFILWYNLNIKEDRNGCPYMKLMEKKTVRSFCTCRPHKMHERKYFPPNSYWSHKSTDVNLKSYSQQSCIMLLTSSSTFYCTTCLNQLQAAQNKKQIGRYIASGIYINLKVKSCENVESTPT